MNGARQMSVRSTPFVTFVVAFVVALAVTVSACDTDDGRVLDDPTAPLPATTLSTAPTTAPVASLPPEPMPMSLVTPWPDGAPIPQRYTCDGDDVSPPMTWSNVPVGTVELAITVTDPDAGGFVHWIVYGIDPTTNGIAEDAIPPGAFEWPNSFGNAAWGGPCPPPGDAHLYQFTVHALNQQLEVAEDASAAEVISTLNLVAIEQRSVSGTYARAG